MECILKIFLYDPLSSLYRYGQEKSEAIGRRNETTVRNLGPLEYNWVRIVLCSDLFFSCILSWLADCGNLAGNDYFRVLARTAVL